MYPSNTWTKHMNKSSSAGVPLILLIASKSRFLWHSFPEAVNGDQTMTFHLLTSFPWHPYSLQPKTETSGCYVKEHRKPTGHSSSFVHRENAFMAVKYHITQHLWNSVHTAPQLYGRKTEKVQQQGDYCRSERTWSIGDIEVLYLPSHHFYKAANWI